MVTSTAGVGNSHYKRRELPIHGAQVDDITQAMLERRVRGGGSDLYGYCVGDEVCS